ncbi:MAG: hypothetical protein H6Q06_2865 [Acidobacteria bacterium]|nr:hypothetical protein [Acidobacteriota bacterium]
MSKSPRAARGSHPARSVSKPSRASRGAGISPQVYLSHAILILSGFILFLPLAVSYDFYEPFVFLKSILFRLAVGAMVFLYVVLATLSPWLISW